VSVYWYLAVKSFQKNLAYRAANLAGIATNTFFGAIYILIYQALYVGRNQVGGLTLAETITYAIIAQSLLNTMSAFGNNELSDAVVKGTIATDLSRPVDFYLYWAAIDLGRATYYMIFRGVPVFVLGALFFGVVTPSNPAQWLLFVLTICFGIVISFAFRFITNSLAFWTSDAKGALYLANTLILFFAGFIVPLRFFPPALRTVAEVLPFGGLAQLPVDVYLGKLAGAELGLALVRQLAWLVVLVVAGRWVLARMVRRVVLAGG